MSIQKQEVGDKQNSNDEFNKIVNKMRFGTEEEPDIKFYIEQNLDELIELFTDAEKTKLMLERILKVTPVKSSPDTQRLTISYQVLAIIIGHVNGDFNQTPAFIALIDTILPANFQTLLTTDINTELKPLESLDNNGPNDNTMPSDLEINNQNNTVRNNYWETAKFKIIQNAIANLIVFLQRPESSPYLQHFKSDKIEAVAKGRKSAQAKKLLAEGFKITEKGIEYIKALTRTTIEETVQNLLLPKTLNQRIDLLTAEKRSLSEKYTQLETEYQSLKSTFQQIQSELATKNKNTDNTPQLSLDKSQEEIASLKRKISEISTLNTSLTNTNKNLSDENSELKENLKKKSAPKRRRVSSTTETLEPLIEKLIYFLCSKYNHTLEKKHYNTLEKKHRDLINKLSTAIRSTSVPQVPPHNLKTVEEKLFWFLSNAHKSDNVNISDNHNWSLLHIACFLGDLESVKQLLEKKADVKNENSDQCIPFTLAARYNHVNVVKIFFEKKKFDSKKNKLTAKSKTALNGALEYAIYNNYFEMTELLLNNNLTPEWSLVYHLIQAACASNKKELLNKLLSRYSKEAPFYFTQPIKESIVALAPNEEIVKLLLQYGFPLKAPHLPPFLRNIELEVNPFSFCAIVNDWELLQELLKQKQTIEEVDLEQALYLSVLRGYENILKAVLSSTNLVNFDYAKVINLVLTHTPEEKKSLLLSIIFTGYTQKLTPAVYFKIFESTHNFDHLKIMIDNNFFKYQADLEQLMHNLFSRATEQNATQVVNLAIEASKIYTNARSLDNNNSKYSFFATHIPSADACLLKAALESSKVYLIRMLLHKGVNVNAIWYDYTALHYAVEKNDEKLVELLLEFQAKVGVSTTKGTALKMALDLDRVNLIKLLANPSYSLIEELDKAILSVLDFVFKQEHKDISLMQKMMKYIPSHLIEKNINDKLLSLLVSRDHSEIINCLLPLNINWNAISPNVLDLALSLDHIKIVRSLKGKVKPNILKFLSDEEQSLFSEKVLNQDQFKFFVAVLDNNFLVVKTLIDKRVIDVNVTAKNTGTTGLMLAAAKGNDQMVRYFIEKGAKVDIKNSLQLSALDLAKLADRTDIIHLLEHCSQINDDIVKITSLNTPFPSKNSIFPGSVSFFPTTYNYVREGEVQDELFNDDLLLSLLSHNPDCS